MAHGSARRCRRRRGAGAEHDCRGGAAALPRISRFDDHAADRHDPAVDSRGGVEDPLGVTGELRAEDVQQVRRRLGAQDLAGPVELVGGHRVVVERVIRVGRVAGRSGRRVLQTAMRLVDRVMSTRCRHTRCRKRQRRSSSCHRRLET